MALAGRLPPAEMFPAGRPDLRTRIVELASGVRVRVVEAGDESSPPLVFLPGWGCSVYIFRETLAPLAAAGFHAIAADLKGHGLSDKPDSPAEYTTESMRSHVVELLDALGILRAGLCGLSMGAALASHVAAAFPQRVSGLVLVSPVGFDGVPGLRLLKALTPMSSTARLASMASRTMIRAMLLGVYGKLRRFTERDVDEYWAPTQFPGFTRAMRHLLHEYTWNAPFPQLDVPSLTIVGTRDYLAPRRAAAKYARRNPQMITLVVPGAGHVVFDEAPALVNRSLVEFFRAHSSDGLYFDKNDTDFQATSAGG